MECYEGLPSKVRVLAQEYKIYIRKNLHLDGKKCFGVCHKARKTIELSTTPSSGHNVLDTLLHEILHAIFYEYCLNDDLEEEQVCLMMGRAWSQIFLDNPDLLHYINIQTTKQRNVLNALHSGHRS